MSVIQKHTHSLQELNPEKESWNILARVVRLWFVEDYTKGKTPFSMEIVLQDQEIIFNCDGEDATKLKKMMWDNTESPSQALTQLSASSKVSLEDDFIKLHPRSSIEGLKDFKQVQIFVSITFVVKATIKHVLDHDDWWYTACICNKAVYPDSKMFFCEKCNKHVIKVTPRFKLKLRVIDSTDSTTFVVFDRDASAMLKKSCSDILELQDKNTAAGDLPKEFEVLIDKTYLFKVECKNDYNSKFEQSFRVKKVCMDEKVIESFSDVEIKSLDLYSANEEETKLNEPTNNEEETSPDSIAEDLLIKFTEESNDFDTLSDHLNNIVSSHVPPEESLKKKIHELTRKESSQLDNLDLGTQPPVPVLKRQSRSMVQENKKIPVKMLKKNIKIEK
ncbi:replication factor A1 [Vigna unguiculata]|uniref:Replication factor A1 n=1 Tax=Vigna unguiculata TaxID=3917 RepID=A0A4D6NI57_VIGUN|nr:replication factor A1 [Vigna unguiculata]